MHCLPRISKCLNYLIYSYDIFYREKKADIVGNLSLHLTK